MKLSGSGFWNYTNQTMTIKANNSTKTTKTKYDFQDATVLNQKYFLKDGYPFVRVSGSGNLVDGSYVYDFTIKHDDDGTKTIPIYALIPLSSSFGVNWTVDIDLELPDIPVKNTLTCSYTSIDEEIKFKIAKADDNFTSTLSYMSVNEDGSYSDTFSISTKTSNTSIEYQIPTATLNTILSKNKTRNQIILWVYLYTYSGNTQLGYEIYTFNIPIKEISPTVSATFVDTNSTTISLTGNSSKIVKYISKPKVTITAQAQQQADISSYSTVWGNSSSTAQETTFSSGIDSNILTVSAKDSRNWVGEQEYNLSTLGKYVEYIKPNFSKFTLSRPESTSNTINADLTGVWFNNSFGTTSNTLELKYRYKEKGGEYGEYQTITLTTNENNFSFNGSIGSSFNYQKQYDFEFVLTDKLMSVITTFNVESGESIVRIAETYVRILGDLRISGNLDVSGNINATGDLNVDGNFTINGEPIASDWDSITGKPTFAEVATTGAYSDLTGRPSIPSKLTVTRLRSSTSYNTSNTTLKNGATYDLILLLGKALSSNEGYCTAIVPVSLITTSEFKVLINDESAYVAGVLTKSGNNLLFKHDGRTSNGYIRYIYGVTV